MTSRHDRSARVLACAALTLTACTRPADVRDVPGTYVMNRGRAADTLIVGADRRYRRVYVAPGQAAAIDTGGWSVDTVGDRVFVTFEHFSSRWRADLGLEPSRVVGYWPVEPERTLDGLIRLVVNSDLGLAYVQRKR
jgi:hypothetical protein